MTVSQEIGGVPALTAALEIPGGIVAAIVGQQMLHGVRIPPRSALHLCAERSTSLCDDEHPQIIFCASRKSGANRSK
jgi:hypothetical protein